MNDFDERVEAYLTGRLSDREAAAFCDELMDSKALQQQVAEARLLLDGLSVQRQRRRQRWVPLAAAGLMGAAIGAVSMKQLNPDQIVITGAPAVLAGATRGAADGVLVLPDSGFGVTLLLPLGAGCSSVAGVEIIGPSGRPLSKSGAFDDPMGLSVTIASPEAGIHRAVIRYVGCPAETRSFFVAPDQTFIDNKVADYSRVWRITETDTKLVAKGGKVRVSVEDLGGRLTARFEVTGMGSLARAWNEVADAELLLDGTPRLVGTLVTETGEQRFEMKIADGRLTCRIFAQEGAKGDQGGGTWDGDPD